MTSTVSPGLQIVADPVGKHPAGDALDGDHPVLVVGRGAERIIAPHFLAADLRLERQMLPGLEREGLAQARAECRSGSSSLRRSRARSRRLSARGNARSILPVGVGIGARQILHRPPADGRGARCDGRAARRGSAAGRPAPRASPRPAPPRSPSDIPSSKLARVGLQCRAAISSSSNSSTSNSSGTKRQHQSSPSAMRRALSSVPSPSRTVHSDASSR